MLRLLNVAIPALPPVPVRFDLSPESVSPPGLLPMATVTLGRPPGNDVTLFPKASWTVTLTAGVMMVPAVVLVGCTVKASCAAGPALTVTVAVCVMATELTVADTLSVSAVVALSVPVTTPLAFVVPTGCVKVLPVVGLAARTTVAPWIGLPLASLAVTVMVDVPLPAAIGDVALTVDCAADTAPAFTTTVAVCVMATALIVADTVPVAPPFALVVPTGCVRVFPAVGVAASVTVAPAMGLPKPSFAVTVMVLWLVPLEAVIGDVAVTVDCVAERAPGVTTTVALCVTATPSTVAVTVLDSATVALKVPVATPLAFVVALGCVRVLPLPVAASTTVAP